MIQISVLFSDTHRLSYNCCWWKSIPISSGMNKKNSTGQHDFIMPSPGSAPKMPSSLSNHCQMRRMGLEYLWQHLAWTYGKCRKIRHTWMVCVYIYIYIFSITPFSPSFSSHCTIPPGLVNIQANMDPMGGSISWVFPARCEACKEYCTSDTSRQQVATGYLPRLHRGRIKKFHERVPIGSMHGIFAYIYHKF